MQPLRGVTVNPLSGQNLYIDPHSTPADYAKGGRGRLNPEQRKLMQKVAQGTQSKWFSKDWTPNLKQAINKYVSEAAQANSIPVLVMYDIPNRDGGQYSAGGASVEAYKKGIDDFVAGIGNRKAVVILEPDALAQVDRLNDKQAQERFALLQYAVSKLKSHINTKVYIDSGNPGWKSAKESARLLTKVGIQNADGFALNVSNFFTDQQNITYGEQINEELKKLGFSAKHFVIDSSRNGKGANGEWCNPKGRALGRLPTTNTNHPFVDAFLWIKNPGESDGEGNGGPSAGTFWVDYALELAKNAKF